MQSHYLAISAVLLSAACATGPASTVEVWPRAESEPLLAAAEPATEGPAEPTTPSRLHSGRLLVGGTTDRGGGGFTLGGQYEYRLAADWGVGGFADVTFGSKVAVVIGAAGYWRPIDRLTLLAGPGVDLERDDIFVRVGGAYDFAFKDYVIGPALYIDLGAKGTPILLGLSISLDF
jgi:hypothetical protein